MKIIKFNKFILEAQEEEEGGNVNPNDVVSGQFTQVTNDTPENYIDMLLIKLKGNVLYSKDEIENIITYLKKFTIEKDYYILYNN